MSVYLDRVSSENPHQSDSTSKPNWVKISLLVASLVLFGGMGIFGGIGAFASQGILPHWLTLAVGTVGHGGCMSLFTIGTFLAGLSLVGLIVLSKATTPQNLPQNDDRHIQWSTDDLKALAKETMSLCAQRFYTAPTGERITLQPGEALHQCSRPYLTQTSISALHEIQPRHEHTELIVEEKDSLEAAQTQVQKGRKVVVVNFAGPETPGGGFVDEGIGSQEEDICYRSDLGGLMAYEFEKLFSNLGQDDNPSLFPLYDRLLFTPDVTVFRRSRLHAYSLMQAPFRVGILSSAPLRNPPLTTSPENTKVYRNSSDQEEMENRITNQLYAAYHAGYDTIILGAFGCGAFSNPPEVVARLYHKVINEHFQRVFKTIVFAILDDPMRRSHNPSGNLQPFRVVFETA